MAAYARVAALLSSYVTPGDPSDDITVPVNYIILMIGLGLHATTMLYHIRMLLAHIRQLQKGNNNEVSGGGTNGGGGGGLSWLFQITHFGRKWLKTEQVNNVPNDRQTSQPRSQIAPSPTKSAQWENTIYHLANWTMSLLIFGAFALCFFTVSNTTSTSFGSSAISQLSIWQATISSNPDAFALWATCQLMTRQFQIQLDQQYIRLFWTISLMIYVSLIRYRFFHDTKPFYNLKINDWIYVVVNVLLGLVNVAASVWQLILISSMKQSLLASVIGDLPSDGLFGAGNDLDLDKLNKDTIIEQLSLLSHPIWPCFYILYLVSVFITDFMTAVIMRRLTADWRQNHKEKKSKIGARRDQAIYNLHRSARLLIGTMFVTVILKSILIIPDLFPTGMVTTPLFIVSVNMVFFSLHQTTAGAYLTAFKNTFDSMKRYDNQHGNQVVLSPLPTSFRRESSRNGTQLE